MNGQPSTFSIPRQGQQAEQSSNDPGVLEEKEDFVQSGKSPTPSLEQQPPIPYDDPATVKRITRKIDLRLLPLLILLYTLTFLDRVNIGNARLWHLEADLGMAGYDYNIVVLVFYVPYVILEIPSNMLLSRIKPRYYLSGLMLGWGITVTLAGFCRNYASLVVVRVFIGIFEAGMFPGCLYLISSWYPRHKLNTRLAWFLVANDIAGSISGLLGAGLGALDGKGGYSGWSWIFFVEGAMTVAAAALAFLFILPFPHESEFLEPHEKTWYLKKLEIDAQQTSSRHEQVTFKGVWQTFKEWKVLNGAFIYLAICTTAYSIAVFTPTILRTFGWSSIKSNLLSSPIRIASGIISVTVGIISDRTKLRGPFCVAGFAFSCCGLFIVMLVPNYHLRYMGLYFAAMGIYIAQPLTVAWVVNQTVGGNRRGSAVACLGSAGQIGGIISAVVYPIKDAPMYVPGVATCIAFNMAAILVAVNMSWWCHWENKQRDLGKRDYRRDLPEDEIAKLGDKHPDFRYTI